MFRHIKTEDLYSYSYSVFIRLLLSVFCSLCLLYLCEAFLSPLCLCVSVSPPILHTPYAFANSYTHTHTHTHHPHHFQGVKWLRTDCLCSCEKGWPVPHQTGDAEPQFSSSTHVRTALIPHLGSNEALWGTNGCFQHTHSHTDCSVYIHTMQVSEGGLDRWWIHRRLR